MKKEQGWKYLNVKNYEYGTQEAMTTLL